MALGSCRNSEPAQIGTTAPDFTVSDGQKTVQLSQLRGKPVLLNFWATWCPPCVQEVPDLVALQQQMGDKVIVLAVSMDEDEAAYKAFTAKNMPGVLTVRDPDHKSSAAVWDLCLSGDLPDRQEWKDSAQVHRRGGVDLAGDDRVLQQAVRNNTRSRCEGTERSVPYCLFGKFLPSLRGRSAPTSMRQ